MKHCGRKVWAGSRVIQGNVGGDLNMFRDPHRTHQRAKIWHGNRRFVRICVARETIHRLLIAVPRHMVIYSGNGIKGFSISKSAEFNK